MKQIAFDQAKDIWQRAFESNDLHVPFLTYTWHTLWYELFGAGREPFVLVNDDVVAPFTRHDNTIQFSGGKEIADYLDIIGPEEKKISAWQEIIEYCNATRIETVVLRNIPEDSPTITYFQHAVRREDTTPKLLLPDSWKNYVESLPYKHRHELERKMRKFEREHPEAYIRQSARVEKDLTSFISLMEKDPAKRRFLTPEMKEFFMNMANHFTEDISLLLLYIQGNPAAATLSFVFDDSYFLYNSGFDKSCCKNAGFYLKAKTIQYAIEHDMHEYNFLQGNERYKYELGGEDFGVYSVDYKLLLTDREKSI